MKNFKITTNFMYSEFRCNDGTDVPIELVPNITIVSLQLEIIRSYFNNRVFILSAFRTPQHNKIVHGALNSYHLTAQAVDFYVKNVSPGVVQKGLLDLMQKGDIIAGGIGRYKTFTHYDIRGSFASW